MEGPKGPGPDVKRRSPPPALTGMHRLPSRRPQGCQGSAACAPSHQLRNHRHQLALLLVEQRRPAALMWADLQVKHSIRYSCTRRQHAHARERDIVRTRRMTSSDSSP